MTCDFCNDDQFPAEIVDGKLMCIQCEASRSLAPAHGSGVAPMTLNQRVAIARDMLHLTLNEAAKKIGVSPSLVSLWENGQRTISQVQVMKIAYAYGMSLDWLLNAQLIPRFQMPETKRRRIKCQKQK